MRFGFKRYIWDPEKGHLMEQCEKGPLEIAIPPMSDEMIRVSRDFVLYIEKLKAEILKQYDLNRKSEIERIALESHDGNAAIVSFCRYIPPILPQKFKRRKTYIHYRYI